MNTAETLGTAMPRLLSRGQRDSPDNEVGTHDRDVRRRAYARPIVRSRAIGARRASCSARGINHLSARRCQKNVRLIEPHVGAGGNSFQRWDAVRLRRVTIPHRVFQHAGSGVDDGIGHGQRHSAGRESVWLHLGDTLGGCEAREHRSWGHHSRLMRRQRPHNLRPHCRADQARSKVVRLAGLPGTD